MQSFDPHQEVWEGRGAVKAGRIEVVLVAVRGDLAELNRLSRIEAWQGWSSR